MKSKLQIGMFGFGTVGQGVYTLLDENRCHIEWRLGKQVVFSKIAGAHPNKDRGIRFSKLLFSSDTQSILEDKTIDVVIELTGNPFLAADIIEKCLKRGTPVITANKALLALKGPEYYRLADQVNTPFGYEAAVCSGTPAIHWIANGYSGDMVMSVIGILNSTTNRILDDMEKQGLSLENALSDAQQAGFAEPDSSLDIDGLDTAHKLTILIHHALDSTFKFNKIPINGISEICQTDLHLASTLDYKIKLIGFAEMSKKGVSAWVNPVFIANSHPLANVNNLENGVQIDSVYGGPALIRGIGAGEKSAAAGVVGDLVNLVSKPGYKVLYPEQPLCKTSKHPYRESCQKRSSSFRFMMRIEVPSGSYHRDKLAILSKQNGINLEELSNNSFNPPSNLIYLISNRCTLPQIRSLQTTILKTSNHISSCDFFVILD